MSNWGSMNNKPRFALSFHKYVSEMGGTRISTETRKRMTAMSKLIFDRPLTEEDKAWLDKPMPMSYPKRPSTFTHEVEPASTPPALPQSGMDRLKRALAPLPSDLKTPGYTPE